MSCRRLPLAGKLFLSYLLVVAVGTVTLFLAVDVAGPVFFAQALLYQMPRAGMAAGATAMLTPGSPMAQAIQQAFATAMLQTHLVAVALATLAALLVSLFVSRQIVQPLRRMLRASRRIAGGHYAERVPVRLANVGDELGELAESFNAMATALEQTERRRLELIGDVAHELRTPIATLEGYLEGLLDGVVDPSPSTWARLHDEAGRLRRLVDDLQELSRAEARQLPLTLQPTPPATIVQIALERTRGQFAEKGLTVQELLPDRLPLVRADPGRAAQALTNLLTNALRYTPAPGRVTVQVEQAGSVVRFQVTDTGVGFTADQGARLFERFYRAEQSRSRALGGSGIGLTIAKALVEAMGGTITVESPGPGRGTVAAFTLLLAP
jgi:signal transduction histidine kinase